MSLQRRESNNHVAGRRAVAAGGQPQPAGHLDGKVLIPYRNGAKWAIAVSSSVAWAVGEADYRRNVRKLLTERWAGTRWKLVTVPNPTP